MKFKAVPEFVSPKYKEPSTCESCGEEFVCGATLKSCWCVEINLSEAARQELKANFRNCLCQNCLKKYESEEFEK